MDYYDEAAADAAHEWVGTDLTPVAGVELTVSATGQTREVVLSIAATDELAAALAAAVGDASA